MRRRLDEVMREKGLLDASEDAFVVVTEGKVFVNGQKAVSPAQPVNDGAVVEIRAGRSYVGRGAEKLLAALEAFPAISVEGIVAADVGSATGGFTEVLLKRGARKVYAIDRGRGKLNLRIRNDPKVFVMEGVDASTIGALPDQLSLVVIDISLASLRDMLPYVSRWLLSDGAVVALFKPQYELLDKSKLKHGILEDEEVRKALLRDFRLWLRAHGWQENGMIESPIRGGEGNIEYLFWLVPRSVNM